MTTKFNRIVLLVLDSAGIGEMPDAAAWGDVGADTLGNILKSRKVALPNLQNLGLGNIKELNELPAAENPIGNYGKCALRSNGKDTTTGHWEIAGIILEEAFPTFPNGRTASDGSSGLNVPASGALMFCVMACRKVTPRENVKFKV